MANVNKMLYAIVDVKNNQEGLSILLTTMKGISGLDLYAVFSDEIAVVASDTQRDNLVADQTNATEYAGVIEKLAQQFTLLPLRYGSFMKSTGMITELLKKNYKEFQQNLRYVENKYEFGLKVFGDSEKINTELRKKTEAESIEKSNCVNENSIYKNYLYKKLKEHKDEELMMAYVDTIIQNITWNLEGLNPIHQFKKMAISTTIIDAVFLLDKDKKNVLINAVQSLQNQYADLNFVLTGPWAPYNFVILRTG